MSKLILLGGEDVSARIEIANKLIVLGYEVEIIGTESENKFIENNIPYRRYSLNRELNVFKDIKTIFALRRLLKQQTQLTVVHAFDTKPTIFLPLAAFALNNIKVVRTITGMGRIFTEQNLKNTVLKWIYNLIQKTIKKRVDFTIFQNDDDAEYYSKYNLVADDKATVVKSSGLDLQKYTTKIDKSEIDALKEELNLVSQQSTFILVSRIIKQKGILDYLEAAKICYENGNRFNVLLVGQLDSDQSISIEQIQAYRQYVQFLGRREDVQNLLAIADIFVLPTYYREGVPRVLLEASAMGLSLIATNMPGCKDVVIDNYTGKLVNIHDPKDLAEKMILLGSDRALRQKFSINAQHKVKEFSLAGVTDKYNQVYKKFI